MTSVALLRLSLTVSQGTFAEMPFVTFGGMLRDQVELDKLTSELLNVVGETMQPEQVSLWLRADNKSEGSR